MVHRYPRPINISSMRCFLLFVANVKCGCTFICVVATIANFETEE